MNWQLAPKDSLSTGTLPS